MSIWHKIKDPDDVELSDDNKQIYVRFAENHNGNIWVEIPIGFIRMVMSKIDEEK